MADVKLVAWTKANDAGVRGWDVSWQKPDGTPRGQVFRCTEESLVKQFTALGKTVEVEIPRQFQ